MRDVDALLVIAHQSAPSDHPAKGPLNDPSSGQNFKALLLIAASNDLDDEIQIACLVHEFEAVIGAIGEEMFDSTLR